MLLLCALVTWGNVWAEDYSLTPNQSSTGSSATSYITTLTEFTHNGIKWKMNQWNPKSLQVKTNQASPSSEFRFYNTSAFPGKITKVVIKFSALTLSSTSNTGFMFVGGTSEVSSTTGGTAGTWNSTNKTITWEPNESDNFTYFAFYQNGKVATGTNNLASSDAIVVTYSTAAPTKVATPTISGDENFLTSTDVTIACGTDGAAIQYSTDDGANWNNYSAPFALTETTTVKAKATKSGLTDSDEASKTFTKVVPMTVSEAITAINALASNGTIANQYVRGVVSTAGSISSGAVTYFISDDGATTNQLQVYLGKNTDGADFTNETNLELGDEVIVFGTLKNYKGTTPEFDSGSQVVSRTTKTAPTFSLDKSEATLDAYTHETVDVALTTNTDGDITCESSNPDVATVALKSAGVYTITAQTEGSATITIMSATSATYKPAIATVSVTVADARADAGISFAENEVELTWGDAFAGQALTNANSVDVTYSSTDEDVATVTSTGVVTVKKTGSTTIKATFTGNATYKAAVASYTLTINKAVAGLSYAQTAFDVMLNDNTFEAPALINPNGLTVTYSSNNEAVALVGDTTGEIVLETGSEGTVKITASFVGNDNFKSGSAYYTVTVIDPTVKGCKYNPYTVAEVNTGDYSGVNYVKGYIVGFFSGKDSNASLSGNSNLALSDSPEEISGTKTIALQLPSGSLRDTWNIDDNNVIGMEILVKGNITGYFTGKTGVKSPAEITAVSVPVSISAAGWATYCSEYALDFTGVTELTAYTATKVGDVVKFNKVTGKVPANTGLLVSGTTANVPVAASADAVTNILEGVTAETVKTAETVFVLKQGANGLGFYKNTNDFTVRANSAYLPATAVADARAFIALDDEATGISNLTSALSKGEGVVYDLSGRRVVTPTKGLYIVNGKKVFVK